MLVIRAAFWLVEFRPRRDLAYPEMTKARKIEGLIIGTSAASLPSTPCCGSSPAGDGEILSRRISRRRLAHFHHGRARTRARKFRHVQPKLLGPPSGVSRDSDHNTRCLYLSLGGERQRKERRHKQEAEQRQRETVGLCCTNSLTCYTRLHTYFHPCEDPCLS